MRQLWEVIKCEWKKNELFLHMENAPTLNSIKDGHRMLVHSDELAFIYILEEESDYTYLMLSSEIWKDLKQAQNQESRVYLQGEDMPLELTSINEELTYLVQNIEGNSNYGHGMVAKVEEIFL